MKRLISWVFDMIGKKKYGEILWPVQQKESYREFTTLQECRDWGLHHYEQWAKQYKRQMASAKGVVKTSLCTAPIECYCGYSYRQINQYLRTSIDGETNLYRELADILSLILCNAPRIPCDLVLYRMVSDDFIHMLVEGNKQSRPTPAQEKGFMSTSLLKSIANQPEPYGAERNLLKIYVPKDTIGVYVNAVTSRSEEEMLLFPNLYLAMASYPYQDDETGKMVYECNLFT